MDPDIEAYLKNALDRVNAHCQWQHEEQIQQQQTTFQKKLDDQHDEHVEEMEKQRRTRAPRDKPEVLTYPQKDSDEAPGPELGW